MSQVKIGPKFFANELRVYRDWVTAFWRENIQNSFDAGAGRIDITIGENNDGITRVTFGDDGKGMSRNTLENVYFTLGETTKTSNSVGGFGKARILTCFAQAQYTLATRNLVVVGSGADYTIEDVDFSHTGVLLSIDVYNHGRDLVAPLKEYLKRCHLEGCHVYVNGERHSDWTYKNKFERELSFGKVYTNKSQKSGLYVRVNGVQMFSPYISAPFLVVVELDSGKSREVLQASRDGLLHKYQDELESFVNDLNINKQSALRAKRSKSIEYKGTGTFRARREKKVTTPEEIADMFAAKIANSDAEIAPDGLQELKDCIVEAKKPLEMVGVLIQKMKDAGTEFHDAPQESAGPLHSSGQQVDSERRYMEFEMFDTVIEDDTQNSAIRKVIESYYPQNWDLLGQNDTRTYKGEERSFRAGSQKYKLLILWKAACEYAIRVLQDSMGYGEEEIDWGVGWCFSDEAQAKHKDMNGVHWLLLNPCDAKGNMRLGLTKNESLATIVSNAAHEACHIIYGDHDERFANLLNDLMEKLFLYKREILNHMKEAKEAAEAEMTRQATYA